MGRAVGYVALKKLYNTESEKFSLMAARARNKKIMNKNDVCECV